MKTFKAKIEISKGLRYKFEVDKETGMLIVDRMINQPIPHSYGYIVDTLENDGDPIDVFIIHDEPLASGLLCRIEVLGAFECTDQGFEDNKILARIVDGPNMIPQDKLDISNYLSTYKVGFEVGRVVGKGQAVAMIEAAQEKFRIVNHPTPDSPF